MESQLPKLTNKIIFTEFVLLVLVIVLATSKVKLDIMYCLCAWLFFTVVANIVLIIMHLVKRPAWYGLYILALLALPLIPIFFALFLLSKMTC
jgi:hypothetical protein